MALQTMTFTHGTYSAGGDSNGYVLELTLSEESVDRQKNSSYLSYALRLRSGSGNRFSRYRIGAQLLLNGAEVACRDRQSSPQLSLEYQSAVELLAGSVAVQHDSDGGKTLTVTFSIDMEQGAYVPGPMEAGGTMELTAIDWCAQLEIAGGTLGQPLTYKISGADAACTYTLSCRGENGTDARSATLLDRQGGMAGTVELQWVPPLEWACLSPATTTVRVFAVLETFLDGVSIGIHTAHFFCAIGEDVVPQCAVKLTDTAGYAPVYGLVQGKSRLSVTVEAQSAYGAEICACQVEVDGVVYTALKFETAVLHTSGTLPVRATVRDSRGRTGSCNMEIVVLPYRNPVISSLTVRRCDSNGLEDRQGAFAKAVFHGTVSPLNDKNTAAYTLRYKRTQDTVYTQLSLAEIENDFQVSGGTVVFPADPAWSYDVSLVAEDTFGETVRSTVLPRGFVLLYFSADGTAVGVGKAAQQPNALDVGLDLYMNGCSIHAPAPLIVDADGNAEWLQPPMQPGSEYRTIWRYKGMPMYYRMIEVAALPASGAVTIPIGSGIADIVAVEAIAFKNGGNLHAVFPVVFDDGTIRAKYNILNKQEIYIAVFGDMSAYSARFLIQYTK